ncbi:MAG: hypothetical protein M1603_03230 [Candidatus Marsarchaeota archaeon]|jgi:hypothetical protein|nr:hypothetical protein [Candidatus Marsarchaeota archaeon]
MESTDAPGRENEIESLRDSLDSYVRLSNIYLLIISKYKDYIEEKEALSVAELPTLVTPKAAMVARKAADIKSEFDNYDYDANFYDAGMKAFDFVSKGIGSTALPIEFWLMPEETLRFMLGDVTDKSILLCSILIALGNPSSKVVVVSRDSMRSIYVYYEFGGSVVMMDVENGKVEKFGNKDDMLKAFSLDDESAAYEFNDQMYVDIS